MVLELPDNYPYRRKLMETMVSNAKNWINAALERSPNDVVVSLQVFFRLSSERVIIIKKIGIFG